MPIEVRGARHLRVVEPVTRLVLVDHELGAREVSLAGRRIGQSRGMIGMHVCQENRVDRVQRDAGKLNVVAQVSERRAEIVSASRLDQRRSAARANQKSVHREQERVTKTGTQCARQLFLGKIARHLAISGEDPVAQRGHHDVADAAVIDSRNLTIGRISHAVASSRLSRAVLSLGVGRRPGTGQCAATLEHCPELSMLAKPLTALARPAVVYRGNFYRWLGRQHRLSIGSVE